MPNDNDETIWRIVLSLNFIPAIIRIVCGFIGLCHLVNLLKTLIVTDNPNKRPSLYNQHECIINTWSFLILWLPIICDFLLSFSILMYLMDISSSYQSYWTPSNEDNLLGDIWKIIWISSLLFCIPICDAAFSFYFYTIFKKFIETTFKNFLYACNCHYCSCKNCPILC